uniref:Uncharacterized protein n=1 Tax=Ananas comosus var. bracteatus TaxID=296719 RepID=A0A6V7PPL0_ANACO|nr:unnamed protein product [Ananas comosus var. bracteatus]
MAVLIGVVQQLAESVQRQGEQIQLLQEALERQQAAAAQAGVEHVAPPAVVPSVDEGAAAAAVPVSSEVRPTYLRKRFGRAGGRGVMDRLDGDALRGPKYLEEGQGVPRHPLSREGGDGVVKRVFDRALWAEHGSAHIREEREVMVETKDKGKKRTAGDARAGRMLRKPPRYPDSSQGTGDHLGASYVAESTECRLARSAMASVSSVANRDILSGVPEPDVVCADGRHQHQLPRDSLRGYHQRCRLGARHHRVSRRDRERLAESLPLRWRSSLQHPTMSWQV